MFYTMYVYIHKELLQMFKYFHERYIKSNLDKFI